MAPSTPIGPLTDQLVATLVPLNTTAPKLRRLRDQVGRKLRYHSYGRTNQFDVANRLSGLQEKFLVLNNDDLARELALRLSELNTRTEKWLPDALDLLLQLSDHPATKTNLEDITQIQRAAPSSPQLTWAQVEADDPFDHDDQIWQTQSFTSLSSEEDDLEVSSEPSPPTPFEEVPDLERPKLRELDDHQPKTFDLDDLEAAQFWRQSGGKIHITELQAIRETLFMLRGLPTSVFQRDGARMEVNRKYRLNQISPQTFWDLLASFSRIHATVDCARVYVGNTQTVPFMQTLRIGLEDALSEFDAHISEIEMEYLAPIQVKIVSLVEVRESIMIGSKAIFQLAAFIQRAELTACEPIQCLELLFDMTCECEALEDDGTFSKLLLLFLETFKTYLRPIVKWVEKGELDVNLNPFFISAKDGTNELSDLWQDWFTLDPSKAPNFLQPFVHRIFIAGKTMIFLRRLQGGSSDETDLAKFSFNIDEDQISLLSNLIPFSELFESTMSIAVEMPLESSSKSLQQRLNHACGLWRSLEALQTIYLGKDGRITDLVDTQIFDRIDKGQKTWNDRFLVRELLENIFDEVECIDIARLVLRSPHRSSRDIQIRRKSVSLLGELQIGYSLPWAVANILSKSALSRYRRLFTFLLQIRRARYVLERRSQFYVKNEKLGDDREEQALARGLHHSLLLFVNVIYDHFTSFEVEIMIRRLRESITLNLDIENLISVHEACTSHLEEACLASKKLSPIREAVVSVLDLCVRLSDALVAPQGGRSTDAEVHSFTSAESRHGKYRRRRRSDDPFSSDDSDDIDDGEGYSTFIIPSDMSRVGELRSIKSEFNRQLTFIVAGLRSIGRGSEQGSSWEMLAERLDWKKKSSVLG